MNASTLHMEHRWGTRVELFTPTDLVTASGRVLRATLRNASVSGAYIETTARLPLLSRVVLRPRVPNTDWIEACVVRRDAQGLGLEWLEPVLRSVSALLAQRDAGLECDTAPRLQREQVSWQLLDRLPQAPAAS